MRSVSRAYVASRYGQLHYQVAHPADNASAPPLLCLHQTPSSSREWLPILPALAEQRVVVAMDTPGYGMSDPPPEPLGIQEFAQIMAQSMDDLARAGVVPSGPFDVMGMHTGSVTSTELARAFPNRVRKAVLFGLAAYSAEIREHKLAGLSDAFPPPGEDLSHVEKLWSVISRLSDPRMTAEDRHVGMAEALRLGSRMTWGYTAVYRYDFLDAISRVSQPVLVINPEDDLWVVTRETSKLFADVQRLDLPGVSHGVLSLEKDRLVDAINAFLNDVGSKE